MRREDNIMIHKGYIILKETFITQLRLDIKI